LLLVAGSFVGINLLGVPSFETLASVTAAPTPSPSGSGTTSLQRLQEDKLRAEIEELRISNEDEQGFLSGLLAQAPLIAAAGGLIAIVVTWNKQRADTRAATDAARMQRQEEVEHRADAQFASVATSLGSPAVPVRMQAASILPIYMESRNAEFQQLASALVVGSLNLPQAPVVTRALVRCLEEALTRNDTGRNHRSKISMEGISAPGLVLSAVDLSSKVSTIADASLRGAKLDACDLWKMAGVNLVLSGAVLRKCNLGQARLDNLAANGARFNGCQLTSTSLRRASLIGATFKGCQLQSAHFDGADLRGAIFHGAVLKDAYFYKARLDDDALRSIKRAQFWRQAHFSPDVLQRLQQLSL
jgi:uncharacterized protein YjbI with pentapeptide repeats